MPVHASHLSAHVQLEKHLEQEPLLGGSWVVISGVISPLLWVISSYPAYNKRTYNCPKTLIPKPYNPIDPVKGTLLITLLIGLLITAHEPPSTFEALRRQLLPKPRNPRPKHPPTLNPNKPAITYLFRVPY